MTATPYSIPITSLLLGLGPSVIVLVVMRRWSLNALHALYANGRMLGQLLVIGYVLTYIFETDEPLIVVAVVTVMISVSAWIALRPLREKGISRYLTSLVAVGTSGLAVLMLVTQLVLELESWFDPRFVVPLAGMIFANAMNTVSLAAERFEAELDRGLDAVGARSIALEAALIPQINALLAVGLVSLPGMMTGQILSGVDPLIAARYQIMVMCMIFGSAGLAAVAYLEIRRRAGASGGSEGSGLRKQPPPLRSGR